MHRLLTLFAILLSGYYAEAQTASDSTLKHSPLKTLTDTEYNALLKGDDLYHMALAGEMNHYPMPGKVLKFKKQLDLSPIQVNTLSAMDKDLHRRIVETGGTIIRNERTLDSLFKYHRLDNGSLIFYANRYGLYQGYLRNAILQACLATQQALTPPQIKKYESLQKGN